MAAIKGAQLLTETDGTAAGEDGQAAPPLNIGDRPNVDTRGLDEEYVILDEEGDGEGRGEGRLTTDEAGERTALEQRRQDEIRVYTRDEIAAMSADERRQAWRGMSRDEQRANRPLDRARKRDNRTRGQQETDGLKALVEQQGRELETLKKAQGGQGTKITEFERGQAQNRLSAIDSELTETNRRFDDAKRRMAEAVVASDADALTKALDERDTAFVQRLRLQGAKEILQKQITAGATAAGDAARSDAGQGRAAGEGERREQQGERPRFDYQAKAVRERVQEFQDTHSWFDPNDAEDDDSALVKTLDRQVAAMGLDPASDEYWDELDDRLERYLPHHFRGSQQRQPSRQQQQPSRQNGARANAAPQRRGPPSGGGGDAGARGGRGTEVRLSPERKAAMIETGALDRDGRTVVDKVKFQRQLRAFSQYDREHASEGRR